MLTGRRFILREPVIASAVEAGGRIVASVVPSSSVIEIVSGTASGLRTLKVSWNGSVFAMFASDIDERGEELLDTGAPQAARAAHA